MIRSLWTIIVTLAIANTLGIAVLLAWMSATDRLSAERVNDLREMFGQTVTAQQVADDQAQAERDREAERLAGLADIGTPPLTAEGRDRYLEEFSQSVEAQNVRTVREARDRQETLFQWQRDLEKRENAYEAERAAFEAMREQIVELEGSAQFQKTLKVYEGLPPEEAAAVFNELVDNGDEDQVVAYLNAMKPRIASEVTSSILADDPALAARLLERLREHGVMADAAPEEPG